MEKSQFQPAGAQLEEQPAPPARTDRCGTCKFADADTEGEGYLLCRRFPPRPTAILGAGPRGPQVLGTVSSLPRVNHNEWCGEWQPLLAIAS